MASQSGGGDATGATGAAGSALEAELRRSTAERDAALARQAATSEILKIIAASRGDVQPVFQAIADSAKRLSGASSAIVTRVVGDMVQLAAFTAGSEAGRIALKQIFPTPLSSFTAHSIVVRTGEPVCFLDTERDPAVPVEVREMARARGYRSSLAVPLLHEGAVIGTVGVARREPGPFDQGLADVLQTFADQAVIAIENARLFNETKEALERQTASADVLRIISRSVSDASPVFEAILDSCHRLFSPYGTAIYLVDGDMVRGVAGRGFARGDWGADVTPLADSTTGEAIAARRPIQIVDLADDSHMSSANRDELRQNGGMSVLYVPLMSGTRGIGSLLVARMPRKPFVEQEIDFICAFADQAVIAIENARLFEEVQARTRDLEESLAQQTATAEVLQVISRSAFDLKTVLHTLLESAARLCDASICILFQSQGDLLHVGASYGGAPDFVDYLTNHPHPLDRTTIAGRAAVERRTIHIPDIAADTEYGLPQSVKLGGWQSIIGVPLVRDGEVLGVLDLARPVAGPFTPRQIELIETFADQAVIAIENARLFEEVQAKTRDLEEALKQQIASANILKVIASSPANVDPVLQAIVVNTCDVCEANDAVVLLREGNNLRFSAHHGPIAINVETWPITRGWTAGRAVLERRTIHVGGVSSSEGDEFPDARELSIRAGTTGILSVVSAPLMRDGQAIGALLLRRLEARAFSKKQIALLQTFADQAVIAIENTRLFNETKESLERQTATADVLKIIAGSPTDAQPTFEAIVLTAVRLLDCETAFIQRCDAGMFWSVARCRKEGLLPVINARPGPVDPEANFPSRAIRAKQTLYLPDWSLLELPPFEQRIHDELGYNCAAYLPLMHEDECIGVMGIASSEPHMFSDADIALAEAFRDQAVIAIRNTQLFDEVQQRTRELSASLEDLRNAQDRLVQTEKLASLGQLTAGIAHEIKNPLNFVNNFAVLSADLTEELNEILGKISLDAAQRDEIDEISQMLKSNLEKIAQHGKRADSIVKNMLLHSREGSGDQRPTDVNTLVDEALNLAYHGARAERPEFNVTLDRDFDPAAGMVALFPQEITRVLLNLISNAFYAGAKRKEQAGAGFEPVLRATTKNLVDRVEIRIRDNGAGIPPDVREKMFNPFFTTKPPGEGTGLGLSMSHDIVVKQHGGTIDVATQAGAFTEFVVTLPRAHAAARADTTRGLT